MLTDDAPCTQEDRAAIVACARYRREYLLSLADRISMVYGADCCHEAARVLRWVAEGTGCLDSRVCPSTQPPTDGR